MILLDAYALIAFLVGGPARQQVRGLLRQGNTAVATTNLIETLDVSARVHRVPIQRAMEILEPLFGVTLGLVPLDFEIARRAAEIRTRHYSRQRRPISLADAVLLASARTGDEVATADPDVLDVARAEAVETIPLPA